jgi:ubiquinone/menaquinone biosynthesis C-methylase UbiE
MGFYNSYVMPHLIALAMGNRELLPYRERAVSKAEGRVLEIGIGSGQNSRFYTDRVTEVIGIDSHPKLLAMAARQEFRFPVRLILATADALPLEGGSIDTILMTWTLCSIPKVQAAVGEMHRVLKPSGHLLFVEHGLAPDDRVRSWQRRLTPAWKRLAGGCHLDREAPSLIESAGFAIVSMEKGYMRGPKPLAFIYAGYARPI